FQEFSEGLHFIGPTHPYRALSGNVYIFGQLLNNTSTLRLQPTLTVTWLDANGRALRRVGGRAYVLVLAPRQRTPFAVNTGPLPAGAVRYRVDAAAALTTRRPAAGVVVRETSESNDGTHYHFNGTATNATTGVRRNVRVGVALYDPRGFVRSFGWEATSYTLNPHQVHTYSVLEEAVSNVVGVREYLQISY